MTMRFATSMLALSLFAMPMMAQTTGNGNSGADAPKNSTKTKVVAHEAAVSAQDATAQTNINRADIQDLKKRVAALEAQVKDLQDRSKK